MQSPAKLDVAVHARVLACAVYRATSTFPGREQYGLSAQMRRAAVSIGSNIYEGCGRRGSKEFLHYLHMALGSARELEFQILIATDLGFLPIESEAELPDAINHTTRMLARLIVVVGRTNPTSG
jgi:four helix bundle protein